MRILVITSMFPTPDNPAYGIFVREQVESLRKKGVQIDILFIEGYKSKWNYLKAVWPLYRKILTGKYDLIHCHYDLNGWVGRMQFLLPVVVTFHGDDILGTLIGIKQYKRALYKWVRIISIKFNKILERVVDSVIVQSQEMRRKSGYPAANVIPCGIDLNHFMLIERMAACRQLGLDSRRKYLLFAADPAVPRKNFPLAQKVIDIVKKYYPEAELLPVFNQPYEKMPLYMNACDILLFTSIWEGAGVVIKEAMACNLPVVSVDVGDVRGVISGADNCCVTCRDPQAMADRVIDILRSDKRSNGRERIQHLSVEVIAARILEIYKSVL